MGHHLAAGGCPRVEFWGKILSFFPIFWVFWQRFEFFPLCSLNKSCPNFEFWAKNGLEFFQIGQKLSFFAVEFSRKCWKKKPGLKGSLSSDWCVTYGCFLYFSCKLEESRVWWQDMIQRLKKRLRPTYPGPSYRRLNSTNKGCSKTGSTSLEKARLYLCFGIRRHLLNLIYKLESQSSIS